jgi:hypothetical protein
MFLTMLASFKFIMVEIRLLVPVPSGANADFRRAPASRGQLRQKLGQRYKRKSRRTVTDGVWNHKRAVVDHAAAPPHE